MPIGIAPTVAAMCTAGFALLVAGLIASRHAIAAARGLDKIAALANVSVAVPLAVFGALHLFGVRFIVPLVPAYLPWRLFWAYFVGVALIAAAVSIATGVAVRWSGLLFGLMMFLFVATIHLPGAVARPDRIIWTIVFRETSFGGGGLLLAAAAIPGDRRPLAVVLARVGQACVVAALLVFGVEHFLHPFGMPGVPLVKTMPAWVPARALIDYVTGAALLAVAASVVLGRAPRVAAAAGGWLLLLLAIYVPVMVGALSSPGVGVELEGVNYFADTLLFTGVVLALSRAYQCVSEPSGRR